MPKRHPGNRNIILHTETTYKDLPVYTGRGPLAQNYLDRILETIQYALSAYPRVVGFRFDLHIPTHIAEMDNKVISRFFDSLKAQISVDLNRRSNASGRKRHTRVRYVWVREHAGAIFWHYHVLLLLNQDAYKWIGDYKAEEGNMAARIKNAWASALRLDVEQIGGLVHFVDNPIYHINTISGSDIYVDGSRIIGLEDLFYRVSYFAKVDTKNYGENNNHFGCSHF